MSKIIFLIIWIVVIEFRKGNCQLRESCNCIPNSTCRAIVARYKVPVIHMKKCGWTNDEYNICCPKEQIIVNKFSETSEKSMLPIPSESECGLIISDKIINGEVTELDEFPWMALLEYTNSDGTKQFKCGGSLINERYVLTAGHCLIKTNKITLTGVRLGEWNVTSVKDCDAYNDCADLPLDIPIEQVIFHELFVSNRRGTYHDIALIRLAKTVTFTYFIKPICLPILPELKIKSKPGQKYTVAGWGATEISHIMNDVKLKAEITETDLNTCQNSYKDIRIIDAQICAGGQESKDSCRGDSGGPLMKYHVDKNGNNYMFLVGIVSFGHQPCGQLNVPGVYTRVASYIDWIQEKIR